MKILAVDTSTASGSMALLEGGKLMAEWTLFSAQTHNRRLLKMVDTFLEALGWAIDDVDGFAVTAGPGSFTGLRIGLTTVKTLAWTLGKPFAAVPSLDALAAPLGFAPLPVCALLDARRNEVYFGLYHPDGKGGLQRMGPYLVMSPARVADRIEGQAIFCGDGWLLYRDMFSETLGSRIVEASAPYHIIRAGFVGELGRRKFLEGGADDPVLSVPLYVRPSEAELRNPHLVAQHSQHLATRSRSDS
jgi:tRNA threonylcarbamoyladenosine biosynthesis protein TsaB